MTYCGFFSMPPILFFSYAESIPKMYFFNTFLFVRHPQLSCRLRYVQTFRNKAVTRAQWVTAL